MPKNSADLAFINPAVLRWAIKRSKLSNEFIADELNVRAQDVEAWTQAGGAHPPFQKALDLAKILHVPFGFFYLKNLPSEDLPLPDFRGFNREYQPSNNLVDVLNDVLLKQDWYRDHEKESSRVALKFVGSFDLQSSIFDVASDIRRHIGITQQLRQAVTSWGEYVSTLTRQTEQAGVLVMRSGVVGNVTLRKLKVEELQGFAMADPYAPIIFVNSSDFKASQVFTIAHELAHIWIGQTAIANADELGHAHNKTESFCNRVAAEVLVPQEEFLNAWRHDSSAEAEIRVKRIARQFWVSGLVSLRRARELKQVTEEEFTRIKDEELKHRSKATSRGGDYYRNLLARMSARFTAAVVGDVHAGKLQIRDAAHLLGMKVPTFVRFAETWK